MPELSMILDWRWIPVGFVWVGALLFMTGLSADARWGKLAGLSATLLLAGVVVLVPIAVLPLLQNPSAVPPHGPAFLGGGLGVLVAVLGYTVREGLRVISRNRNAHNGAQ